jgi:putative ABC transport system permease protein
VRRRSRRADFDQHRSAVTTGVDVVRPATRSQAIEQLSRAFETNLTALSLLALVVGMFLIYNTVTFSLCNGVVCLAHYAAWCDRREIFLLVLLEALLLGIVGAVLGTLLGVVLGRGLVTLVTRTINDLYFVVTVRGLSSRR